MVKVIVLPNKVVYVSFVSNIIQLTFMCFIVPTRLFKEIITDTIWLHETPYLTQYFILDIINLNHVIYQALTVKCFSGLEFQITAVFWVKMIFRYYFVREDKINTRRETKRKTKIWINNDSTWSIVKYRKLVLVWCSLHTKIKLMDQIKRKKKSPLRSYPTNTQQTMSWEARPWHFSYHGQMFGVLSAGSNVGRIVRAKRNMKIANSSQFKIFFHRFFILIHWFIYFWRRSDGGTMHFSANSFRLYHHTP